MIGSSQKLLSELGEMAQSLGIRMSDGRLEDAEADRINEDCESDSDLYRELTAWLSLYEAARVSVERGVAISFS